MGGIHRDGFRGKGQIEQKLEGGSATDSAAIQILIGSNPGGPTHGDRLDGGPDPPSRGPVRVQDRRGHAGVCLRPYHNTGLQWENLSAVKRT